MWSLLVSVAIAQVSPGDFGRIPSLFPPPDPVERVRDAHRWDDPESPLRFAEGSALWWDAGASEDPSVVRLVFSRAEGPLARFYASGSVELTETGDDRQTWTVVLSPKGFRGRRRLDRWVDHTLIPWIDQMPPPE